MIHVLFPTLVKAVKLSDFQKDKSQFKDKAINLYRTLSPQIDWRCDTFSTLNSFDMISDPIFENLIHRIIFEVTQFSKDYGVNSTDLKIVDAWINVAAPGAFQEYHMHTASHFSVVYYINIEKNSGAIVFRSFEADTDMFPLPIKEITPASYKTMSFTPEEGTLLIFRSNLKHLVEKNLSTDFRISISMNLVFTNIK